MLKKKLRNKSKDFHFGLSLALTPPLKDALMGRFFNWHIRESFPRRVNETIFRGKQQKRMLFPRKTLSCAFYAGFPWTQIQKHQYSGATTKPSAFCACNLQRRLILFLFPGFSFFEKLDSAEDGDLAQLWVGTAGMPVWSHIRATLCSNKE